jgi:GNAT superfamily N-acetyltransferase
MPRIEIVPAIPYVEEAAQVLRDSWRVPCVHYTSSYLYWQCSYRLDSDAIAAVAIDGNSLIGHSTIIPRRMEIHGRSIDAYHLTFVCVVPEHRCRGIASRLYDAILQEVGRQNWPLIAFTREDSPGDRAFSSGIKRANFTHHQLGDYIVHGYLYRSPQEPVVHSGLEVVTSTVSEDSAFVELMAASSDRNSLEISGDPETLRHWSLDPRGSRQIRVRRDGRLVAGAMIVRGQVSTMKGLEPVTSVEQIYLAEHDPVLLKLVCEAAGAAWFGGTRPEFVSLPNLAQFPEAMIREAGIRQTPTKFLGHLAIPKGYDASIFDGIRLTNLAVG